MSEEKNQRELEETVEAAPAAGEEPEEREDAPEEEKEGSGEGLLYCWAQALIAAVVGVVLLFTFAVRLIGVSGPSMQDTLYTGDRLLVLNAMFCDFKAGDVVVINDYNAEPQLNETLVKRIVAVGGQTVDIDFYTGVVYVDGQALDEPYTKEATYTAEGTEFPLTLAEDEVFVMGDNRNHSSDSRDSRIGLIDERYIMGRTFFRLAPLDEIGMLR